MGKYYVSPGFRIIERDGVRVYDHFTPETPITVRDTVHERGSIQKDTSVDWLEETNQKMEGRIRKGLRGK